ncbi:D-hexose-6-phosphate mutarotase [Kocuria sp.]|uniref:D-hexose-6-phosphate mutarotase n=1 Tax=Kocuria sp. TaxID=1871328 RepID=UPI0026DBCE17|nr:D-hexose-6-phosphate mutarotase [Kocuria sp.]MDO4918237.1 D-hexose-6-phosphate mutarotase [Kocuria sp.]
MTRLPEPLVLSCASGEGSVLSHGAHALSWAPAGVQPVLFVSALTRTEVGSAVRGGVPVCFPWFGPGRSGDMEPAHGFARITEWQLVDTGEDAQGDAFAQFLLTPQDVSGDLRNLFPREFEARLRMSVGRRLRLELTVTNTGAETFEMEEALHSYLRVGDCRRVTVSGFDGVSYHDKVAGQDRTQNGDLTLTGETDAVFHHRGEVRITDPELGRVLVVSKEGSDSTIVWNPWEEKAAGLADLADDEWRDMLCVEAGNVLGSAVRLGPGESHTLAQVVEVQELPAAGS